MESSRGKITTFYSHKGGTGRSMALANVAYLLSRRSDVRRGVLVIDWDLEAPGLHWFFRKAFPNSAPEHKGVIELFEFFGSEIRGAAQRPLTDEAAEQIVRRTPLDDFVVHTHLERVDLMTAGRLDGTYGQRVSVFDWRGLFDQAPSLIRSVAECLTERYDHVLVDSRTGLNDISGICTALLPDQLVLVFTANRQSLIGGIEAVTRATAYRIQSEDLRPLVVFPLPSRIDVSEPHLLEKWRFGDPSQDEDIHGYQNRFETLFRDVYGLPSCDLRNYFDEVQIQHVPRYSYGEEIAALLERGTRLSVSRSYAAFADVLAREDPPWSMAPSTRGGVELLSDATPTLVKVQAAKEYLSEDRFKMRLHDLVTQEVRDVLRQIPRLGPPEAESGTAFAERLHAYEGITNDLLCIQALLGYWGDSNHRSFLAVSAKRICDQIPPPSGSPLWVYSHWYPALLLLYAGGVAAVAAHRYDNLRDLMLIPTGFPFDNLDVKPTLINVVTKAMIELDRIGMFAKLPGLDQRRTPRSDYLYGFFERLLEDLLFLGPEYEVAFDRFEVLYALEYGHLYEREVDPQHWGPIGRFAWKKGQLGSPLDQVIAEAESQAQTWSPIRAGLFDGSLDRFRLVATNFRQMVRRSRWGYDF